MHKLHLWIGGGIFIFVVVFVIYQMSDTRTLFTKELTGITRSEQNEPLASVFYEQKDETGPVTISITPVFIPEDVQWVFEFTLQTHTVLLAMNILESVVLVDIDGTELKPLSWDGDEPGGHHRSGALRFSAIKPLPKNIVLRVKNIAEVPLREFVWEL